MPCKVVPRLSVLLYNANAVPWFGSGSDFGAGWYSILSNEADFGTYSYNADYNAGVGLYVPQLEYIGSDRIRNGNRNNNHTVPIGLVCRPFIVPKDIGSWSAMAGNAGTFEILRGYTNPPYTQLVQTYNGVNSSGTTTFSPWGSQSNANHPVDPSFAFTMFPLTVSPEYSESVGGVPYSALAWSGGIWQIRFFHNGNPILFKNSVPVMELAQPARQSYGDIPDQIIGIVRVQRGALMISLDQGATYDVWWETDGSDVYVPSGVYQFTGIGGTSSLGIHQVFYETGTYDSPRNPMIKSRSAPSSIGFEGRELNGTDVAVANIAPGSSIFMQYRATLTPATVTGPNWPYYYSPELYAVSVEYNTTPTASFPLHDGGTTFEGRILRAEIEKPLELDGTSFSCTIRVPAGETIVPEVFLNRLIRVTGGWEYDNGFFDDYTLFTGFIVTVTVNQENPREVTADIVADNTSYRAKRFQWRRDHLLPFDGLTVNSALSKWLQRQGLDDTYITFDTLLGGIVLPKEFPEEPAYMPTGGEPRWDIAHEFCRYAQLELAAADDGDYRPIPNNTWTATPHFWKADALPSETDNRIEEMTYSINTSDNYTGVEVQGKNKFGAQMSAWIEDTVANTDPTSTRFKPWPEWHLETIDFPVTPQWLSLATRGIAYEKLTPQKTASWKGELSPMISRRDAIRIYNAAMTGITNIATVGVLTLRHVFDRNHGNQAWTELSGIRIEL